jgi:hypothetical protein
MTLLVGDLRIPVTEEFGPKLNSRTVAILHPDMHQTNQDLGRERVSQRRIDRSTWLPNEHLGNLTLKDIHQIDSNNDVVVDPTAFYENQKVGPGEPLSPVGPRVNEKLIYEELNSVYLKDHYSQSALLGEPAQADGKVLYTVVAVP